ncbi:MAG: hypothetical protein LBD48_07325 [Treponema sp.]|jgi:hypothetical protein|nr:hypothetical protein [Treponema sp.]
MKKPCRTIAVLFLLALNAAGLAAQDFGFGFEEAAGEGSAALPVSVKTSGEIGAAFLGYVHDFGDKAQLQAASLGDVVSGSLNFGASGANVDAFIGLNLSAASIGELFGGGPGAPLYTPLILDEAFLRAYFGPVNIEAGLRKLTWGRADSLGPLDIVNPLDYSDLTRIADIKAIKIARPMVHLSWNMDSFSKLEAVFLPNFAGHRFAASGRWAPAQFGEYPALIQDAMTTQILNHYLSMAGALLPIQPQMEAELLNYFNNNSTFGPVTSGLEYFQTGLRYTATIASVDIGAQYFYGNLFRPSYEIMGSVDGFLADLKRKFDVSGTLVITDINPSLLMPTIKYNRYHQFGLDYAQVLAGFNVRAEFAVHLTEDFSGDDGAVHNPFIGWSAGFDRDLVWGINANIQCNETVRLLNGKVGSNPVLDCEADTSATATRLTVQLSRKFLKDNLECKTTAIWDIEDKGCYIIPGITWVIKDITTELSAGVFAGTDSGELGQYWENSFVKIGMKYSF